MKFTIETVSKMTGIPAPSLRNWEKRYGFPNPDRTAGGHRYYTASDVEFLKKAVHWIEEGQSLNEIAKVYKDQVGEPQPHSLRTQSEIFDDVSYRVELIYEALLKFDQMATLQHYATLSAKLSVEQLFDRVFESILLRLNDEEKAGRINVAQKHFATAFVRLKLSTFLSLDFPPTQGPRILLATLSEESAEGGLMLIAGHLKFRGYPVYYFGTDLPEESLKSVSKEIKPDVICLSYAHADFLARDVKDLSLLKIPVCICGAATSSIEEKAQIQQKIHVCQKAQSSEVAQYVEMLCQSLK
jgi:DNA-binding transcriptional MerR regulator